MEKKKYQGKLYNNAPLNMQCPMITIEGNSHCVLKDCYVRAIGAVCPPEAPVNWEQRADFLVKVSDQKPEEWI